MRFTLLALLATPLAAQVTITYLANEGVMIAGGGQKVLVDALFRDSLGDYQRHTAAVQEALETGRAPFDQVKLALATHFHLDHWDPSSISRFLRSNPGAHFASTAQGMAMLPSEVRARTKALAARDHMTVAGVDVNSVALEHAPGVQNLGLRIAIGGRAVVHAGDANPTPENFSTLAALGPVDVALVPYWWLLDTGAAQFLHDEWKVKHVIALHLGAADATRQAAALRSRFPGAWICTVPGESRRY